MITHGVFISVFNYGILITGQSRIGKSALALELIARGHQLIADDAPEFQIATNGSALVGQCPAFLQNKLAVHPLGILNIEQLFGKNAICSSQTLHFMVHLTGDELPTDNEMTLINGHFHTTTLLNFAIPQINFSIKQHTSLALLTEMAIQHYFLNREQL